MAKDEGLIGPSTKGASDRNNAGVAVPQTMVDRLVLGMKVLTGAATGVWFGPQDPPPPVAPEETEGRQFDYPYGYNLNTSPRSQEGVSFAQLRALADNCDLLRMAIETRKDQICRLSWAVKPKDSGTKPDARCEEVTKFLARPDRIHDFTDWLRMVLEDLLVIDAPTIYLRRTLGGKLLALEPIDGATIAPLIDGFGRRPIAGPAFSQQLKGMSAVQYEASELIYKPRNPRTHKVYGFSQVEQIVLTIQIAMRRALSQFDYFESGTLPDGIAGVPDTWTGKQIKDFQEYFDLLMTGDAKKKRSIRFMSQAGATSFKEVKQPEQKSMYDEWIARIICYCFSLEVTPFVAQVNRATSETNREQSRTEGELPIMNWVKQLINNIIVEQFGYTDIEWVWAEEKDIDPKVQADIDGVYIDKGVYSADYVRARLGIDKEDAGTVAAGPNAAPAATPAEPQLDADGNPIPAEPQLDADGKPIPPQLDADGNPLPALATGAAPAADVQGTALNGTQITSLQGIVQSVIDKQMPAATAKAMIGAAFPTLTEAQIDAMLTPIETFEPEPKAVPAAFGGAPAVDENGDPVDPAVPGADAKEGDDKATDDKAKPKAGGSKVVPFGRAAPYGDLHIHIESPIVDVAGPVIHFNKDDDK